MQKLLILIIVRVIYFKVFYLENVLYDLGRKEDAYNNYQIGLQIKQKSFLNSNDC